MITQASQIHRYNTRNCSDFAIHTCNTQLGSANFYIRALVSYNKLPNTIRNLRSISSFKLKLREFVFNDFISEQSV
jgi:hypothetical protein